MPSWTKTGTSAANFGVERLTASFASGQPEAIDGSQIGYSNGGPQTFTQQLSANLTANTKYTLSESIGCRLETAFAGYGLELLAGSTILAQDINGQTLADNSGTWITSTLTYTALAGNPNLGQPLSIVFLSTKSGQTVYDNVTLDATAVPEPTAFVLFGLGAAGALIAARRRRASPACRDS